MTEPTVRITVDGKLALTVEQAAERYGLKPAPMRTALARFGDEIEPVTYLDGRKPLYLASRLDAIMAKRPGKGGPGVPRPHKPPTA